MNLLSSRHEQKKIGMSAQLPKSLTKKNRQTERRKNISLLGVYKIPLLSLSIFHTISPLLCLSSSIILSLSKKHIHTHTHTNTQWVHKNLILTPHQNRIRNLWIVLLYFLFAIVLLYFLFAKTRLFWALEYAAFTLINTC